MQAGEIFSYKKKQKWVRLFNFSSMEELDYFLGYLRTSPDMYYSVREEDIREVASFFDIFWGKKTLGELVVEIAKHVEAFPKKSAIRQLVNNFENPTETGLLVVKLMQRLFSHSIMPKKRFPQSYYNSTKNKIDLDYLTKIKEDNRRRYEKWRKDDGSFVFVPLPSPGKTKKKKHGRR